MADQGTPIGHVQTILKPDLVKLEPGTTTNLEVDNMENMLVANLNV